MIRQTSAITFHAIEADGLLGRLQMLVYKTLYQNGPLTQMECCREIDRSNVQDRSLMPRFAELETFGVICAVGERECRITGRIVLVWDVTDKLPVRPPKRKTKDEIIEELKAQLAERDQHILKLKRMLLDLREDVAEVRHER